MHTRFAWLLPALAALVLTPTAAADTADETALAEKYAPVVRLVYQAEECGPGELEPESEPAELPAEIELAG